MPHVLLIEDDPALRLAFRDFLIHSGFQVTAITADEAAPDGDIVVCDYRLPGGKKGTEVIEMIRARLAQPIPAIVVTGDLGAQAARDAAALGNAKLLLKPVAMDVLVAEIRSLLNAER
jgi:DNA-binding NarL/FixJ family response regulator